MRPRVAPMTNSFITDAFKPHKNCVEERKGKYVSKAFSLRVLNPRGSPWTQG